MKNIILLLLLLCSVSAQAQTKYTVSDTSNIVNSAGLFFEVRDVLYSNGEELHTKTLLGDTASLFSAAYSRFIQSAEQMSTDARYVLLFPKRITELNKDNSTILSATGMDVLDSITARLGSALLEDGWTLRTQGAAQPADIVFSVNNNGQLRYTITGQAARNAWLFGAVIHLLNYLGTGDAIDLYRTESGNYKTVDNRITLRRPGGPANRSALAPPPETVPDPVLAEPKNGTPVTPAKAGGTGTDTKKPKKKRRQ